MFWCWRLREDCSGSGWAPGMPPVWQLPVKPDILQGQGVAWKQRNPFRGGAAHMPYTGGPLPRMSQLLHCILSHWASSGSLRLRARFLPLNFLLTWMAYNACGPWDLGLNWRDWLNTPCSFVLLSQDRWEHILLGSSLSLVHPVLQQH